MIKNPHSRRRLRASGLGVKTQELSGAVNNGILWKGREGREGGREGGGLANGIPGVAREPAGLVLNRKN